jgi:hypothetical protein
MSKFFNHLQSWFTPISFAWLLFFFCSLFPDKIITAQNPKQTIQGRIFDNFTETPLPGVNIIVIKDSLQTGTITNAEGEFAIKDLPIGKYTIKATFVGYENFIQDNLYLSSGRAINIDINLSVKTQNIDEVSISAWGRKNDPRNNMAVIGARSFTLEETNRYAGAYGDPARMAMNYAGVLPVRDNRNDIIIRGNSATGLQWRIEDIEIPNPNHFGASGTTGGPITIINTNLLAKSDFFNGAFPAEYGNAIAGVFDLKMKSANTKKHEKWIQTGWNGLEFGAEGPLGKNHKSSYIFSYRHAITDIVDRLGADLKDKISYKDLSFKLNFPKTKTGNWSVIGMGGNSQIITNELDYSLDERTFDTYGEKLDNYTSLGVLAVTNRIYPGKNMKITNILAATENTVKNRIDTFDVTDQSLFLWAVEDTREIKFSASTNVNYKISSAIDFNSGIIYDHYLLSFNDMEYIKGQYLTYTDTTNAQASMLRAFMGFKYQISPRIESYLGLHALVFLFNNSKSLEPRGGIKFTINDKNDIAYGFGLHSQTQPKVVYFVQTQKSNNQVVLTNKNLNLTRSIHNTLGYNYLINKNLRLKVEAYYQYLFDVPIRTPQPEYSSINFGTEYYIERKDSLTNDGSGQNYGLEFTLERYLHQNFFYLFTASLFESNYTSADNHKRNTAYNGKFAINMLGGYELTFPKKYVSLIFGLKLTYAGGSPYVPFDPVKTVENGRAEYDWSQAYQVYREDYKRASLRLGVRRNFKTVSMETTFDFQYRTNYTSIYLERIDVTTGEIIDTNKMGFYPMINMRISF